MLFAVATLFFLLVNVNAQFQECQLAAELQKVIVDYFKHAYPVPNLIWNENLSGLSLAEIYHPGNANGLPYIKYSAVKFVFEIAC
ncbi:hypothetical protein TELCIR_02613 [Teladorsagia circumcincta]|uniref:Uncharacterized protein n=1 Tax=Teladorsagia circumcincta TaxID=45464 RepID=A0A2G9UYL2_TELCI|nr:hypothetical protein TELCIR_02613 [Teladorsagia circumcincta]